MTPTRGITLLADITQRTSLSKVMRDLAAKLKEADIPFRVFDPGEREDRLFKELNGTPLGTDPIGRPHWKPRQPNTVVFFLAHTSPLFSSFRSSPVYTCSPAPDPHSSAYAASLFASRCPCVE